MLIEDDPGFTYLVQRYARRSGCHMVSTRLGEEALTLAQQAQPAVIVLDVDFPGTASWEMLTALKADRATRDIPVVMCSILEQEARGLEAGAEVCLSKPVMYYDFLTALADAGWEQLMTITF
jgi:CheY-like chemotaxis protein